MRGLEEGMGAWVGYGGLGRVGGDEKLKKGEGRVRGGREYDG